MAILFIDFKANGNWNKSWATLLSDPIIESWSDELENQISAGMLQRQGQPVTLVVVHDEGGIWDKLKKVSAEACRNNISPPFRLKISTGTLDGQISEDGWGCNSGRAIPSNRNLSHLAPKFHELADRLAELWKANPADIHIDELKQAWSAWNHDTMIEKPNPSVMGESARSPVQSIVEFSQVLVGFAIVTRAWLCQKDGSARVPVYLADEVGTPVWWWSALGLATDEKSAFSLAESACKTLREKRDALEKISDEAIRQESQATCDKIVCLIKATMNRTVCAVEADAALTALGKNFEIIINA